MPSTIILKIEHAAEHMFHVVVDETAMALAPAVAFLKANGGPAILALAEQVLTAAAASQPWAATVTALMVAAEKAGILLLEGAAGAILSMAEANLKAKGAPATISTGLGAGEPVAKV